MEGRSRPREATSVQRRMEGLVVFVKEVRVEERRGWEREPWVLWIVRDGFVGEVRRGHGQIVGVVGG